MVSMDLFESTDDDYMAFIRVFGGLVYLSTKHLSLDPSWVLMRACSISENVDIHFIEMR
jgi:hypothetical protein